MRRWPGAMVGLFAIGLAVLTAVPAAAAAALTVETLTWNVVGLDSNDPSTGPNRFLSGVRTCNVGDEPASDAQVSFVWGSANPYLSLVGPDTVTLGSVAPGVCTDAYFLIEVTRDPAAYLTARRFHIEATAAGLAPVTTPQPRELLVERLISQARNQALTLDGPADVFVGQQVVYDVTASTATNGYEQLQNFLPFPHAMFRIVSIEQTYTAPAGGTNDRPYADACGWDHDPTSGTYRSCIGPGLFAGGRAGGDLTTRYTVEIVGTGVADLADVIYDHSGSSYHYNADFGDPTLQVRAREPIDLSLDKVASDPAPRVGEPFTYTLRVTNTSPTAASGVTVTDTAPAGLRLLSGETTAGTFDPVSGVWTVGSVPADGAVTLVVTAVADVAAELTNVAEVTAADEPDRDSVPGNGDPTEDDLATVTVRPGAPVLAIDKQVGVTDVVAGGTLRYAVVVTNTGTHTARTVVLTDAVPEGAAYVPGTTYVDGVLVADAGGAPVAAGLPLGDVAPGQSVLVTYDLRVDATSGTVTNVAVATSPDTPDATATTTTPVVAPPAPVLADEELPATGLDAGERSSWALSLWSMLLGWALVVAAHRLDRRQRIRAINVAHAALLRAQRTGTLWQR